MHQFGQTDDFGNKIRFSQFSTPEEWETDNTLVDRWEISTSTYGGDSVTDCNEV